MPSKNWAEKAEDELEKYYDQFVDGAVAILEKHVPKSVTRWGIRHRIVEGIMEHGSVELTYEVHIKFWKRREDGIDAKD